MTHAGISFENGSLSPVELAVASSALLAGITFADADGIVRYYSAYRIFSRTPAGLDRDVFECHSERSRPGISRMLSESASGCRDDTVLPAQKDGRDVKVCYAALRDGEGSRLGYLETARWADARGI